MGLFNRIKDPVEGTAQVAGCTAYSGEGVYQNIRMNLVVQALGVEPFTLEHKCLVHAQKWPSPGQMLPVVFDRQRHQRLKIKWDEVAEGRDVSRERAEAMRDALAGGAAGEVAGMPGAQVIDLRGDPNRDAILRSLEAATGQDLDGDGRIGGVAPATPPGDSDGDRLAQLERLARLRDSGALTDEEFAAEKRRLLG
jgi:hypothetical protein